MLNMEHDEQRVEGHAKGLTTSNLELRENLKKVEAEKQSWERRYMSLQAKEQSLVRQIESAIQQRTEALQFHLSKGGTGALAQLMDQVRQHQMDLFAAQELLRTREEELSKIQSEKEILEGRISGFANEMKELRQAAGPTANLISKLREDAKIAQDNERAIREELQAMKDAEQAKLKNQKVFSDKSVQVPCPASAPGGAAQPHRDRLCRRCRRRRGSSRTRRRTRPGTTRAARSR
jgi:DNA repair exonuclease SbcCD ATPase subunit